MLFFFLPASRKYLTFSRARSGPDSQAAGVFPFSTWQGCSSAGLSQSAVDVLGPVLLFVQVGHLFFFPLFSTSSNLVSARRWPCFPAAEADPLSPSRPRSGSGRRVDNFSSTPKKVPFSSPLWCGLLHCESEKRRSSPPSEGGRRLLRCHGRRHLVEAKELRTSRPFFPCRSGKGPRRALFARFLRRTAPRGETPSPLSGRMF